MSLFRYEIADAILEMFFSCLVLGTVFLMLGFFRELLGSLSVRTRRRFPFGSVSVLLALGAWWYGTWALARCRAWQVGAKEDMWDFMRAHSVESYLLLSGLILIVSPAVASADVWRNFHRRNPETVLRKLSCRAVLVLRNFAGDESDPSYVAFGGGFRTPRKIEMALEQRIRRPLGPLVTLGSPGDFSPAIWGTKGVYNG